MPTSIPANWTRRDESARRRTPTTTATSAPSIATTAITGESEVSTPKSKPVATPSTLKPSR